MKALCIETSPFGGYTKGVVYEIRYIDDTSLYTIKDNNGNIDNAWSLKYFKLLDSKLDLLFFG